jgi:hypothetical protein
MEDVQADFAIDSQASHQESCSRGSIQQREERIKSSKGKELRKGSGRY